MRVAVADQAGKPLVVEDLEPEPWARDVLCASRRAGSATPTSR